MDAISHGGRVAAQKRRRHAAKKGKIAELFAAEKRVAKDFRRFLKRTVSVVDLGVVLGRVVRVRDASVDKGRFSGETPDFGEFCRVQEVLNFNKNVESPYFNAVRPRLL